MIFGNGLSAAQLVTWQRTRTTQAMHASVQTVSARMSPMEMPTLVIVASVHLAMKETLTPAGMVVAKVRILCIYNHFFVIFLFFERI